MTEWNRLDDKSKDGYAEIEFFQKSTDLIRVWLENLVRMKFTKYIFEAGARHSFDMLRGQTCF